METHKTATRIIHVLLSPFGPSLQKIYNEFQNGKGGASDLAKKVKIQLPLDTLLWVLKKVRDVFSSQPVFLDLDGPVNVCGDIHGQYSDLVQIFFRLGFPSTQNYLFLGDYVDRGDRSIEVIMLLFCYKIIYPQRFFMLRGNHESASITKHYGFYKECMDRYGSNALWKSCIETFNMMPCSARIGRRILCMHGGLSPNLTHVSQLNTIKRPTDIPDTGLLCDILWSDPEMNNDTIRGKWGENSRGVSYTFGESTLDKFLKNNDLDLICRGHQVVEDGYEFFGGRKLVTVFSAPRYCGEFDNKGAVLVVSEDMTCSFVLFE